jgi:hypothetical protein
MGSKVQVEPKNQIAYRSKNVKTYVVNMHNNQTYSHDYIGAIFFLLMQIVTNIFFFKKHVDRAPFNLSLSGRYWNGESRQEWRC